MKTKRLNYDATMDRLANPLRGAPKTTTMTSIQAVKVLKRLGMPDDVIEAARRIKAAGQLHLVREAIAAKALVRGGYMDDQAARKRAVFAALEAL